MNFNKFELLRGQSFAQGLARSYWSMLINSRIAIALLSIVTISTNLAIESVDANKCYALTHMAVN